ncbi:MAG TPA: P-loop NTPase fold protein [Methylotenera sp.]
MTIEATSLSAPRMQFDESKPFHGDLFKRKELAEQLTGYIDRLRDGTVLAIDAPWGEGKSWFGRNWAASLKTQDYRVIYLDAFQQDYVEDPFLLIASEINELIASDVSLAQDIKENAAKVMKAILPVSTKILMNIASRLVLGSADGSKFIEDAIQSASDSTADATQIWLEDKIDNHKKEKESLDSFRSALQTFCESQTKPVVFFIDELDRCRPNFAVRLIERLKHFFDVPNLVFVLLLNRDQLEKAIKGVYGSDTDASSYLGKFIHMYLRLPKNAEATSDHSNANWNYLWKLADHYKMKNSQELNHFIKSLSIFASTMNMSLRDLEKGMSLLALNGVGDSAVYLAWPVALKLMHPNIFNGLLKDEKEAHHSALKILEKINTPEDSSFWIKKYFLPFHISKSLGNDKLTDQQFADLEQLKPTRSNNPLRYWLQRLDIAIQD